MTEVIRLALYTEVLGPWECDCAGGRLPSTDTGLADVLPLGILNISALSTISSYGSASTCLSSIVTNKDEAKYVSLLGVRMHFRHTCNGFYFVEHQYKLSATSESCKLFAIDTQIITEIISK